MKKNREVGWDPALSIGENVRLQLPQLTREFFASGRELIASGASPIELHGFRLAAKRFRYTLELFRPLYGPGLEQKLESVRRIQSILGKRQDCAVLAQRIREHGDLSDDLRTALDKLERQGLKLEQEFRAYWLDEFDKPGAELLWSRYFARRPSAPKPIEAAAAPAARRSAYSRRS